MEEKKKEYYWHFFTSMIFLILISFATFLFYKIDKISTSVSIFDFFLMGLAVFRIVRLVNQDLIFDFARDYFDKYKTGARYSISQLINCPWCVGIWSAFFIGFLYFLNPFTWFFIFILALAGAGTIIYIIINFIWNKL